MTEEEKMTEETKLIEETKLFEEKKAADPFITGFFLSLCQKRTQRRLLKRYWRVCLKILMTVIVMMWRVEM
jgi:hypothetical protein